MRFNVCNVSGEPLDIPDSDWEATPPSVKTAFVFLVEQNQILAKQNRAMAATIAALEKRLAALEERLNTNSRNSGKPPSSDPPGTLPNRGKPNPEGKKQGGQPGHQGHSRKIFSPSEIDGIFDWNPEQCSGCGCSLDAAPSFSYLAHQIVELPEKLFNVFEHRMHTKKCPCCNKSCSGELPAEVSQRKFGPRLTSAISVMSGVYHMSRRDIVDSLRSIWGISISLGTVSSHEGVVTHAVRPPCEELDEALQDEEAINMDDTGWRKNNKYACLWVATSSRLTVYKITPNKTSESAAAILGKFNGVLTSDRATNLDFFKGWRQTCWAHLDRHFVRMSEREGLSAQVGLDAMEVNDHVFHIWHQFKAESIDADQLYDALQAPRAALEDIMRRGTRCGHSKTENTCQNILDIYERLWTFSYLDGVEPTNNAAEQKARAGVAWRKTSYGSQSERGTRFAESILTISATCRQQGRSVLGFIEESILAMLKKIPGPTLRPPPAPA